MPTELSNTDKLKIADWFIGQMGSYYPDNLEFIFPFILQENGKGVYESNGVISLRCQVLTSVGSKKL